MYKWHCVRVCALCYIHCATLCLGCRKHFRSGELKTMLGAFAIIFGWPHTQFWQGKITKTDSIPLLMSFESLFSVIYRYNKMGTSDSHCAHRLTHSWCLPEVWGRRKGPPLIIYSLACVCMIMSFIVYLITLNCTYCTAVYTNPSQYHSVPGPYQIYITHRWIWKGPPDLPPSNQQATFYCSQIIITM